MAVFSGGHNNSSALFYSQEVSTQTLRSLSKNHRNHHQNHRHHNQNHRHHHQNHCCHHQYVIIVKSKHLRAYFAPCVSYFASVFFGPPVQFIKSLSTTSSSSSNSITTFTITTVNHHFVNFSPPWVSKNTNVKKMFSHYCHNHPNQNQALSTCLSVQASAMLMSTQN